MAKFKYLTIDERHNIEQCLNKQKSFKETGRMLNRDPTTISKEVVGHIKVRNTGGKNYPYNACKKRNVCKKVQSVCKPCHHSYARDLFCARCGECNGTCSSKV